MKKWFTGLLALLLLLTIVGCGAQQSAEKTPPVQETTENVPLPKPVPDTEESLPTPEQTVAPEAAPETEPKDTPKPEISPEPEQTPETEPEISPAPEPEPRPSVLPILMYHHVVPNGTECNDMTVTTGKLAGDLQWLTDHGYEPILPRDLVSDAPLPEKPILITFDDGYRSNYELAYPIFQQYQAKAVISIMVYMQDVSASSFLSWDMCREMVQSGLVEIGSHAYKLHNLDGRGGNFTPGGINGVQRDPEETDADFQTRVLDDLQKSHDLIEEKVGQAVTFFAYPFGIREADAEPLIDELFPVTVVTLKGTANLADGIKNMPRWTVTMNTSLASILPA